MHYFVNYRLQIGFEIRNKEKCRIVQYFTSNVIILLLFILYCPRLCRMESMENGLIELELVVPAIQLTASAAASLSNVNGHVLQLDTKYKMPKMSSLHKVVLRFGNKLCFMAYFITHGLQD